MYNEFIYRTFNKIFKNSNQQELDRAKNIRAMTNKEHEIKSLLLILKKRHSILKKMLKMDI